MHPRFAQADTLSGHVIGAAIEVHRELGPGLLESIYERCLTHELTVRGHRTEHQKVVQIRYKSLTFDQAMRFDLLVDDCLLIEAKAVENILPVHKAQLLSYMKLLNVPLGLLINFHEITIKNGIARLLLPGANLAI
jgi:GxxExxY protein